MVSCCLKQQNNPIRLCPAYLRIIASDHSGKVRDCLGDVSCLRPQALLGSVL